MAGRKPDFRVMFVEDNDKGRKTWFKVGAAWKNEESGSVGVEVNIGLRRWNPRRFTRPRRSERSPVDRLTVISVTRN